MIAVLDGYMPKLYYKLVNSFSPPTSLWKLNRLGAAWGNPGLIFGLFCVRDSMNIVLVVWYKVNI